jgi:predicted RNase H-like nuclease
MSSTDRILVAAQDITDALKHPHPDVPFSTIEDDKITALEKLSEIFKRKFPISSSRGNTYVLVLYDYGPNTITTDPMKIWGDK